MKLHLHWDNINNNGVIQNSTYSLGALFEGIDNKPDLGFEYDTFNYCDFTNQYIITINGIKTQMTQEQEISVKEIAENWVQVEGQEGNPNLEQLKYIHTLYIKEKYNNELNNGFVVNLDNLDSFKLFSTFEDIQKIKMSYDLAVLNESDISIRTFDYNFVDLKLSECKETIKLLGNYYTEQLQKYWTKKDNIESSTTKEDILSIQW